MIAQKKEFSNFNKKSKFLAHFLSLEQFSDSTYQLEDPFT